MSILINSVLVSIIGLTGVILRYFPFHTILSNRQKKKLIISYATFFIIQLAALFFIFSNLSLTPKGYKMIICLGGFCYFTINCIIIPNQFFKHIFILSLQSVYSLFLHSIAALFTNIYFSNVPINNQFQIQSLGFLFIFLICSYPLYKFLKNSFLLRIGEEKQYYWKWIWLVPCFTLFGNMITTMNGAWISTWQQFFARIFMSITVIASWKCINIDFEELDEKIRVKNENELLNMQIKSISDSANLIEKKEEKIRILRHDIRHHTQMLFSLISENENDKALDMLKNLNNQLSPICTAKFCQNQIVNSAISIYAHKAISFQTKLEYKISLPKELPFDENDIAILFANVLDNAVNASVSQPEENRTIKINSRYEQNQLVILVENYFAGEVSFDNKGIPISNKDGHGFGMKSILYVVNKYNGTAIFTHENNIFTAGFVFFKN